MMVLNKRGNGLELGSGISGLIFVFMIFFIAAGITSGLYGFYGKGYDFRETEAGILFDKVEKCLDENGNFADERDFYEKCEVNENVLNSGNYLVYIKDKASGKELIIGVYDFKNRCGLIGSDKRTDFPICQSKDNSDVEIVAATNQNSRSVAV